MTTAEEGSDACGERRTRIERDAREWLVRLSSGTATHEDAAALSAWRQVPEHEDAFRDAARLWKQMGEAVAAPTVAPAIAERRNNPTRRHLVRGASIGLAATAAGGAAVVLRWPERSADHRTGTGEIRTVVLADDLRIDLDAGTSLDARFDADERRLILHAGAVALSAPKVGVPLTLVTEAGLLMRPAPGAELVLRCRPTDVWAGWFGTDSKAAAACLGGSATVAPGRGAASVVLGPGDGVEIGGGGLARVHPIDALTVSAWRRGLMIFRDTPLAEVVEDLNRYRSGHIVMGSRAAARRRVTGVFQVARPDEALATIRTALALSEFRIGDRIVILR
ncbi:DUF4880 domain-containing protein [uncultured Methylobacterium sp.]|jgi:transmembrane sensor|uniref:FecR family protein n=1 Tax=uncultured Methylobacterium sp. TaxID=157278 RepID=UPI00263722F8|nr:DUF4880 domain-containing protein [uncultured Methylobacterium sp.]